MRKIVLGLAGLAVALGATACSSVGEDKAPESCLTALDHADKMMLLAAQGFQYSADAIKAAGAGDLAGLQAATQGLRETGDSVRMEAKEYGDAAKECREEG